jgi:hypothetical protein
MKKIANDIASEMAKILIHNKYLLENENDLSIVIECRIVPGLNNAYKLGKESIIINDLSYLNLNLNKIFNN